MDLSISHLISIGLLSCFLQFLQLEITHSGAPESSCKDFVALMTKKQLSGIASCSKEFKFKNNKEKSARMTCILRCVLIKESILTKDGKLTQKNIDDLIETQVPVNLVDKGTPLFQHCVDTTAAALDQELDINCKVIDPFIKCLLDILGKLCK